MLGQSIFKTTLTSSPEIVSEGVKSLSAGVYWIQVNDNKGNLIKQEKLVKQ